MTSSLLRRASSFSFSSSSSTVQLSRRFTSISGSDSGRSSLLHNHHHRDPLYCYHLQYSYPQTRRFSSACRPRLLTTTTTATTNTTSSLSRNPDKTTIRRMSSSDDTYMSFLEKANADLQASTTSTDTAPSGTIRTRTRTDTNMDNDNKDVNRGDIPASLKNVNETFYVSETDEPFEPVVLGWEGAREGVWPDLAQFSTLITQSTELSDTNSISVLPPDSFDPKGQYTGVLSAVREAVTTPTTTANKGDGKSTVEIRLYRVEISHSKVEYWILGLDGGYESGRIVGVRAKAVES